MDGKKRTSKKYTWRCSALHNEGWFDGHCCVHFCCCFYFVLFLVCFTNFRSLIHVLFLPLNKSSTCNCDYNYRE
ncbi:hypothetical protein SAICODRAFT_214890 [Saitoella complicata NRRL Y-17804]|uniref:uncharacterized protein n=1 Tax=Saitoella complicata (strain BCRC 22490 / CBS 7301 / JCM 7358 / NBRC 10748 / NRRL Y-17804) TaxID=698492 RepID=UPI000867EF06|nr:uncharacterized protein SAICODRAFT_214890 [Saitoella complicata NRRL Y-17804]ODQ54162.1 hypothetical protein SAICODRAFT_214890 [Saitoella complicata NRRL Y-17804]